MKRAERQIYETINNKAVKSTCSVITKNHMCISTITNMKKNRHTMSQGKRQCLTWEWMMHRLPRINSHEHHRLTYSKANRHILFCI
uniref:Uncharacterized protein n=1 Tax=Kalanchoe fedtschenkoi TaxID=63787 RepID=A0A7N0UC12_KALFE